MAVDQVVGSLALFATRPQDGRGVPCRRRGEHVVARRLSCVSWELRTSVGPGMVPTRPPEPMLLQKKSDHPDHNGYSAASNPVAGVDQYCQTHSDSTQSPGGSPVPRARSDRSC